ncbi:MAG: UDP-2,3-diacylglucosamine diphosphatase LpxI [Verrucomicrobiota bacterium]
MLYDKDLEADEQRIGIIAGNGVYPQLLAGAARAAGVEHVAVAAFTGETEEAMGELADAIEWMRVGQLGKMIKFFKSEEVTRVMMAGQISPGNLFDLRPDMRTLVMIGKLKERNAESIFGAIGDEMAKDGIDLLPATTYMEDRIAGPGLVAGPAIDGKREAEMAFGFRMAKEVSALDIGQTVIVRKGTVLAVEAFEGTNECMKRGGALGKGEAVMVKVSKPRQDVRFDVPCIGERTVETAGEAGIKCVVVEAGKTLILDEGSLSFRCEELGITIYAKEDESN